MKLKPFCGKLKALVILTGALIGCSSCNDSSGEDALAFVESIEIQGEDIKSSSTGQMSAVILPENAIDKSITWESSDTNIATVSSNGLVTALKDGTITISATANDRGSVSGSKELNISFFSSQSRKIMVANAEELIAAVGAAVPGDSIILTSSVYSINRKIVIENSGIEGTLITLIDDGEGDRPKLDFSAMSESSSNQGMVLDADYWHMKGIDFYKAGDNGLKIQGSNNLIEFCTFSECADTGLQIDSGGSNNTILNCDSYFNADSSIENADGFACKLTAGTGNKFIGCRAWQNLDDGWDGYLRGADNITTTYENCWAIRNGYLKDGTVGGGDGNGFKTGGSDDKLLKHNATYTNCLAVGNVVDGFDHNSNRGIVTMYNCSAYDNGKNINFSNTNPVEKLIIKNTAAFGVLGSTNATAKDISNNSWQNGISVSEADFQSLDISQLTGPRKADGSLPDITFMHLANDSDLIDKGVDVGLPFNGAAPDLGAFEYNN